MNHDPVLDSAKSALRIEARRQRKALQIAHPEADWMIADHLGDLLAALRLGPGVAALYRSLGAEIDPRPLGDALARAGWRLCLPAVVEMDGPLAFRAWAPGERLSHDIAGLPAPLDSAPALSPALIFAPLLAFDRFGRRLGQGGGFYDRTMALLRAGPRPPVMIGLAYGGQQIEAVPHGPLDQALDGVLTETGYIPARKDT